MIRSLFFNIAFYLGSVFILILLSPFLVVSKRFSRSIPHMWASWVSFLLQHIARVNYRIHGTIPDTPVLFASKHQSAWETIAFNHILDRPAFILKKELLWIPFFGFYLQKADMIALDRDGGLKTLKNLIKQAKDRIRQKRSVVIFPEGTRSTPGTGNTYKKGVFILYKRLNVPVVPVALTTGVCWPRKTFRKHPGTIHVNFLKPIPPGLEESEFMPLLEKRIETESMKLLGLVEKK